MSGFPKADGRPLGLAPRTKTFLVTAQPGKGRLGASCHGRAETFSNFRPRFDRGGKALPVRQLGRFFPCTCGWIPVTPGVHRLATRYCNVETVWAGNIEQLFVLLNPFIRSGRGETLVRGSEYSNEGIRP